MFGSGSMFTSGYVPSIGLLAPKLSTLNEPPSLEAVTIQVIKEQTRPSGGLSIAAHLFCLVHMSVKVAGSTADEIITPIIKYRKPIDMPA
jgi:hypothetical protein